MEGNAVVDLLQDWTDRWTRVISTEIFEIEHRRQIHDELMEMLEASSHPDRGIFGDTFHRMYIEGQVLAIRRLLDKNSRTFSIRRLIGQLQENRTKIDRSTYVAIWLAGLDGPLADDDHFIGLQTELANRAFSQFTDSESSTRMSGRVLDADRNELDQMAEVIISYVNDHVAHRALEPQGPPVTYAELDACIDHLAELLGRYYLFVTHNSLVNTIPTIQGDWKGPFRRPLAEPLD